MPLSLTDFLRAKAIVAVTERGGQGVDRLALKNHQTPQDCLHHLMVVHMQKVSTCNPHPATDAYVISTNFNDTVLVIDALGEMTHGQRIIVVADVAEGEAMLENLHAYLAANGCRLNDEEA